MIHIIVLKSGEEVTVDKEHYSDLCSHRWYLSADGYAVLSGTNKRGVIRRMHRIILGVTDPNVKVDHIDGNRLNNLTSNLRICSVHENNLNRRNKKTSSSRYKGVHRTKYSWRSQIQFNGVKYALGSFPTEVEAAKAYDAKAKELFLEFAVTNF